MSGEGRTAVLEFRPTSRARTWPRGVLCSTGPSSAVVSRAWCDERWPIPWTVTGLLAELALALPTHKNYDAHGTEDPCTDEPTDSKPVPIVVEGAVFVFGIIGIQSRQAC